MVPSPMGLSPSAISGTPGSSLNGVLLGVVMGTVLPRFDPSSLRMGEILLMDIMRGGDWGRREETDGWSPALRKRDVQGVEDTPPAVGHAC